MEKRNISDAIKKSENYKSCKEQRKIDSLKSRKGHLARVIGVRRKENGKGKMFNENRTQRR